MNILLVALGGALGAVLRYLVGLTLAPLNASFPYATLLCNLLGTALLGFATLFAVKYIPESYRLLITVGFCGGFTTFSTFSLDSIRLLQNGQYLLCFVYISISISISLITMWLILRK